VKVANVETIPNDALRLEHLPASDADWPEVWRFANTFNGYEHWGSFERCAEVANQRQGSTVTELRTCLFFEWRRWRHYGDDPDEEKSPYIRDLVTKIREMVAADRFE
jgi:hypothetical protein